MKKIVRLTESDLTRLVKRVISEQLMNYAKLKNNAAWEVVKQSLKMNGFNPSNLHVISVGDGRSGDYRVITNSNLDTLIGYRFDFGKNGSDLVDIFKFVTNVCTSSLNCSEKNYEQIQKKYPLANNTSADPFGPFRNEKKNPHYILFTSGDEFSLDGATGKNEMEIKMDRKRQLLNLSVYKLIGQASVQDLNEIKKLIK